MKTWHWIALAVLTAATVIGQFMESHYWWEAVPGFFAAFGFVGCLLLILGAKTLGNLLVSQKPDYYDRIAKPDQKSEDVNDHAHH